MKAIFPPKRRTVLHGVTTQETTMVIITAARIANPTNRSKSANFKKARKSLFVVASNGKVKTWKKAVVA
jgi:hypothetical protein